MILGVDPGGKGALVWLDHFGKIIDFMPMPMTKSNKPYDKPEVDLPKLEMKISYSFQKSPDQIAFCERPSSYGMLSSSAFTYGFNFALLSKVLERYYSNLTYVQSASWTKVIHTGENKDLKPKAKSLISFQKIFPGYEFVGVTKAFAEGLMDAALIAEHGRRLQK